MADNNTGLYVQTVSGQFVQTKIVDSGGTNIAAVSAAGRISVDASGVPVPITDNNGSLTVDGTLTANAGTGFAPVVTDGSAAGTTGIHLLGTDGTNAQIISTNATGHVNIADGGNAITVDGTVSISGAVDTELATAAALADGAANPTTATVGSGELVYNGTTWDRVRSVSNGQNTTGTGVVAAGILGHYDDVSTGAVTENQFAPVRISSRRALLVEGVASGTNLNVAIAASSATVTVDSELLAAGALADATANPSITQIAGYLMGFNGTTWDRVRTANTGRLQVDVVTGGGSNASILVDNSAFTDGTSSVTATGYIFDEVAGTALTENDVAAARIDSKRAQILVVEDATTRGQRLAVNASGASSSNITHYGGTATTLGQKASSASIPVVIASDQSSQTVDTELPAAAVLGDATANPTVPGVGAYLMGWNGTTWDRVDTANTGRLQVDIVSGASSGAPTSPQISTQTSAALGAGASVDLQTADITTAKTGRLAGVDIASTVPLKVIISTVAASTPTTRVVLFTQPYSNLQWRSPYSTYITQAGGTNNKFRVNVTNKDASIAADVYATFFWDEV